MSKRLDESVAIVLRRRARVFVSSSLRIFINHVEDKNSGMWELFESRVNPVEDPSSTTHELIIRTIITKSRRGISGYTCPPKMCLRGAVRSCMVEHRF